MHLKVKTGGSLFTSLVEVPSQLEKNHELSSVVVRFDPELENVPEKMIFIIQCH